MEMVARVSPSSPTLSALTELDWLLPCVWRHWLKCFMCHFAEYFMNVYSTPLMKCLHCYLPPLKVI